MSAPGKAGAIQPVEGPAQVRSSVRLVASVAWPTGDSGCEAYTAIAWGVGLEPRKIIQRRGREFCIRSKATCAAPLCEVLTPCRGQRPHHVQRESHRNLGGLGSGRQMLRERDGPHREGEEPKPMMHGHEKSDLVIVAVKPTNKARKALCGGVCRGGRSGSAVERRAGAKGNTHQQSTYWT